MPGRFREGALRSDAVDADRASDILQALLADALEGAIEPTLDPVVHKARDADPSGLGNPLQPRGDVGAVTVNIAIFDDHIARIYADAELDSLVLAARVVVSRNIPVQRDGAGDGFDHALKLDKQPVAGGLDDASLVLGDLRVDYITAQRLEAPKGARLVSFHETAVSRDIRREDGREPALDPLCTQDALSGGRGWIKHAQGVRKRGQPPQDSDKLPAYSKWPLRLALVRR